MSTFEKQIHFEEKEGEDDVEEAIDPHEIQKFMTLKAPMDAMHHVKVLSKQLPPAEQSMKKSKEYVEKIRVCNFNILDPIINILIIFIFSRVTAQLRKLEEEFSRKEREQRRRKIILSQQNAQDEMEKSHLEELLLTKLMRQSKQERRIAEGYGFCIFKRMSKVLAF